MAWILENLRTGVNELVPEGDINCERAVQIALGDDSADVELAYDEFGDAYLYIWEDYCDDNPGGYACVMRDFRLGSWMIIIKRHTFIPAKDRFFLLTPVADDEKGKLYD